MIGRGGGGNFVHPDLRFAPHLNSEYAPDPPPLVNFPGYPLDSFCQGRLCLIQPGRGCSGVFLTQVYIINCSICKPPAVGKPPKNVFLMAFLSFQVEDFETSLTRFRLLLLSNKA